MHRNHPIPAHPRHARDEELVEAYLWLADRLGLRPGSGVFAETQDEGTVPGRMRPVQK